MPIFFEMWSSLEVVFEVWSSLEVVLEVVVVCGVSSGRTVFDEAGEKGGSSDGLSELAMVVRGACRRALVSAGSLAGGLRDGTLNFIISPWGNSAVSVASSAAACSRAMVVSASSSAASAARSSVTRVDSSSGRAVFDEAGENGGSSDGLSELAMVRGVCRRALVSAGSLAGGPRDLVSWRCWRTIDC